MSIRKTMLANLSRNIFDEDSNRDHYSKSFQHIRYPTDSTEDQIIQTQSFSSKQDSLDKLLKQKVFFPHKYSKFSSSDKQITEDTSIHMSSPNFMRVRTHISLNQKNDVEDFFTNVEIPRMNNKITRTTRKKQYELVTFTDWVENQYGHDWFKDEIQQQRSPRVFDFFSNFD